MGLRDKFKSESRIIKKSDFPVKIIFVDSVDEAIVKTIHFKDGFPYECLGQGSCPMCEDGISKKTIFYMEVYDFENGQPKILAGAKKLANAISDWDDDLKAEGDEDGIVGKAYRISRLGTDLNPDWQIRNLPVKKKVSKQIDVNKEVDQIIRKLEATTDEDEEFVFEGEGDVD